MTYEQVLALFAETQSLFAETKNLIAETGKQQALTDAQLAKTDEQLAKTDAQLAKTSAEVAKTDRQLKLLAKQVADVTDTMGRFAEEQVRPRILDLFRAKGIELEEVYPRVSVKKDGVSLVEIDLLLVNTIYSVVVEVKNTLRQRDIDDHIERLEKLQKAPSRTIKGTTMYGAIAGMIISEEVEKYAIKKGLYVIKPKGDNVEICNNDGFVPQTWPAAA